MRGSTGKGVFMPYQRTITIYEYIPLDEIRDQLDEEERIMVEVIRPLS